MHRRNLTLRRFGALSFGLGYFEDGVWVDHSVGSDGAVEVATESRIVPPGRVDPEAVHQWYSCCAGTTEVIPAVADEFAGDATQMLRVAGRSAQ